ncbi:MAG: SLATT domain-containing protein [Chitinophagaceae bacterium]
MKTLLQQAEQYRQFAQGKYEAHLSLAKRTKQLHTWLAVLIVLFAAPAMYIFFVASLAQKANTLEKSVAGLLLLLALVLTGILLSFRLSAVAQRHRHAATAYEAVCYRLGMFLLVYPGLQCSDARHRALKDMHDIVTRLAGINLAAPHAPGKFWEEIQDSTVVTALTLNQAAGHVKFTAFLQTNRRVADNL